MKVCPTCQSTYEGPEAFCPNDGTRLQAQPVAAGTLAGATLGGVVKLENLEFGDKMGERYLGRLVDGERPCYVTVFNAAFSPAQNAPRLVETARAKVGSPVPRQLTTLLQVEFGHYPPFVIETAPRGSSLQRLLSDRKKLDWKVAAKLTANVARLVEWLQGQGVTHHGLHPASIYVTDLLHGHVQLGEWYSEEAQWVDNPMQTLASSPGRFVGYVGYMGPELAMKGRAGDLRSAVYALGVLLYELIVGRAPFSDPDPGEVLRRHLTEQPIRLSIARGGGEVPEDLDLVVMMMLEKDPNHRFQAPSAIIGALANLLGMDPVQLAPMIERGEEQEEDDAYSTIEMSQIDRDAVPGLLGRRRAELPDDLSSTSVLRKVETVQAAVAKAEARTSEHAALTHETLILGSATRDNEALVEGESSQKTMMLGNIGSLVEQAAAEQLQAKAEAEAETEMSTSGTIRMMAPDFSVPEVSSLGDGSSKAEILKPARIRAHETETRDETVPEVRERQSSVEVDVSLMSEAKEQDDWERAAEEAEAKKVAKAAAEKAAAEAAEKAAAEAAEKAAAEAAEKAAAEAAEKAAKKAAADAQEQAEREEFARVAAEKAAREEAEYRELEEAEAREAAEKASAEADALIEQAKREAEEKAAAEKAEAEAKAAAEKAAAEEKAAEEKAAAEKAEAEAKLAAEKEATKIAEEKAAAAKKLAEDRRAELSAASPDDDGGVSIPTFEMGTVPAKKEDPADDWFVGGDSALDTVLDEEHVRAAESSNKRTFAIVIGVVVLVVVAFVIWIQFGTHENTYDQGSAQPESPVEEAAPVLDVAEQKRLFETAMEQGRLIAPFGNCALSVMELMKKEAPNAPEYEQMRKAFVERLATGAEAADAAGDLNLARTLAGYGAQWDPENVALKKRADELQARYVGNFNAAQGAQAADAGTADVGVVPAEPAPTDVKVEETKPVEEVKPAEPAKVEVKTTQTAAVTKVETKTQPPLETAPAVDTRQMLKDASAAYARGDVAAARQLYLELVKVDGGNHLVQSGMGQVYFDQAQYNDAVRHQLQAVKLKPSRTDYRVNLGQSYFRLGRFKEAIAAWEEVLRQDPNNANAKQYIELAKRKMN